jgi:hypothetical protein
MHVFCQWKIRAAVAEAGELVDMQREWNRETLLQ